jgi:hypothetical protein
LSVNWRASFPFGSSISISIITTKPNFEKNQRTESIGFS